MWINLLSVFLNKRINNQRFHFINYLPTYLFSISFFTKKDKWSKMYLFIFAFIYWVYYSYQFFYFLMLFIMSSPNISTCSAVCVFSINVLKAFIFDNLMLSWSVCSLYPVSQHSFSFAVIQLRALDTFFRHTDVTGGQNKLQESIILWFKSSAEEPYRNLHTKTEHSIAMSSTVQSFLKN